MWEGDQAMKVTFQINFWIKIVSLVTSTTLNPCFTNLTNFCINISDIFLFRCMHNKYSLHCTYVTSPTHYSWYSQSQIFYYVICCILYHSSHSCMLAQNILVPSWCQSNTSANVEQCPFILILYFSSLFHTVNLNELSFTIAKRNTFLICIYHYLLLPLNLRRNEHPAMYLRGPENKSRTRYWLSW